MRTIHRFHGWPKILLAGVAAIAIATTAPASSAGAAPVAGAGGAAAADEAYPAWLAMFRQKLAACGFSIDDAERKELDELLAAKPANGTGRHYDLWFSGLFGETLEKIGILVDEEKTLRMEYVLKAKPDLQGTNAFFPGYLAYAKGKLVDTYLPVIDYTKKQLAAFIARAAPDKNGQANADAWMAAYLRFKTDFGTSSAGERYALEFLLALKPDTGGDGGPLHPVKESTLLNIRQLVLESKNMDAVRELDRVLNGGD